MKSLHMIGSKTMGGAERSFSRIASSLALAGQDVAIAIRAGSQLADRKPLGVTQFELPFRTVWDPWSRGSISRLIRQLQPDIVQTYMGRATRLTHIPIGKGAVHVARLCGNYKPEYFHHAHAWIACTKWVADYLLKSGVPLNRLEIIPNFLPPLAMATAIELRDARERWGLAEDDLVVGAIGRLERIKGFDVLLRAFARLPATLDGRALKLVLAGEGSERQGLKKLGEDLNIGQRVKMVGWTDRPDIAIRLSDVIAFTSHPNEGFGNVTLEAWAAEKPLVTTRSKGASEVTTHLKNAWQTDCGNDRLLAEGLQTVLCNRDLRTALVLGGRQTLNESYSEDAVVHRFIRLYERLTTTSS